MTDPLTDEEMQEIAGIDKNNRLIKGQVFLWESAKDWHDLWDLDGQNRLSVICRIAEEHGNQTYLNCGCRNVKHKDVSVERDRSACGSCLVLPILSIVPNHCGQKLMRIPGGMAVCETIKSVLAKSGVDPVSIAGIGVDGVGWTLIPVDDAGNPLRPAMIWLDRRAEEETTWLKSLPEAEELVNLDANPLDAAYITPKLIWLKKNQPDIFNSAYKFLEATGFIVSRFTGEFVCDYTQAYGYHFFDHQK